MPLRKVPITKRIWDIMQQQYLSALQKIILLLTQVSPEKGDDARPEHRLFFFF